MNIEPIKLPTNILTPKKEAKHLAEHFKERYRERYESDYPNMTSFFQEHLLFVTMTFRPSEISLPRGSSPRRKRTPLQIFGRLYFCAMRSILGNHLERKWGRQPLAHVFVDFEGSGVARVIEPTLDLKPHVQGLILPSPNQLQEFKAAFTNWFTQFTETPEIDHIDLRHYDSKKDSLDGLMEYCMKGYAKLPKKIRDEFKLMCPM